MHRAAKKPMMMQNKFLLAVAICLLGFPFSAFAAPATPSAAAATPCAVLEDLGGQVELIDSSRTRILESVVHSGIPCGGWVSSGAGWAKIRHRDGHWIHVGTQTLVRLTDSDPDSRRSGDHAVLMKGQVYGRAGEGASELRVSTTNARARIKRGSAVVIFNQNDEETQLIGLERSSLIENRFNSAAKMKVRAGEASSMNIKAMRVVPSIPRAVTVANLKPVLIDLQLEGQVQNLALKAARDRQERKFASSLVIEGTVEGASDGPAVTKRSPASITEKQPRNNNYARHTPSEEDGPLWNYLQRKVVAGQDVGQKILFPDKFYGRPQKVRVVIIDPLASANSDRHREDSVEKARLIEELSQIRAD